MPLIIFY